MALSFNEVRHHEVKQYSAKDAFIIAGIVLTGALVTGIVLGIGISLIGMMMGLQEDWLTNSNYFDIYLLFLKISFFLGVPLVFFKHKQYRIDLTTFGLIKPKWNERLLIIYGLVYLFVAMGFLLASLIPQQLNYEVAKLAVFGKTPVAIILAVLFVGVIAPIVEEFFFRGVIFRGLSLRYSFFISALLSSLVFAVMGLGIRSIIFVFLSGFGYSYLVHKSGSLWPAISAHVFVNITAVVLAFQ